MKNYTNEELLAEIERLEHEVYLAEWEKCRLQSKLNILIDQSNRSDKNVILPKFLLGVLLGIVIFSIIETLLHS